MKKKSSTSLRQIAGNKQAFEECVKGLEFFDFGNTKENALELKKGVSGQFSEEGENFRQKESTPSSEETDLISIIRSGLEKTYPSSDSDTPYNMNASSCRRIDFNLTSPKDPKAFDFGWPFSMKPPFSSNKQSKRIDYGFSSVRKAILNSPLAANQNSSFSSSKILKEKQKIEKLKSKRKMSKMSIESTKDVPESDELEEGRVTCHCKKSKCLKLYCECFRQGLLCEKSCGCIDCHNKPGNTQLVEYIKSKRLSKNPHTFESKFQTVEKGDGTTTLVHKRGCNCKKSQCQKKYCECYRNGVECTEYCCCEECKNKDPNHSHKRPDHEDNQATKIDLKKLNFRINSEMGDDREPYLIGKRQEMNNDRLEERLAFQFHDGLPKIKTRMDQELISQTEDRENLIYFSNL
jgi:hypothetical protein